MNAPFPVNSDQLDRAVPFATTEERALRHRLLNARTIASGRALSTRCVHARALYWVASDAAADWVSSPASIDQLREVLKHLTAIFLAAGAFEQLEGPDDA